MSDVTAVSQAEALPGDLVLCPDASHMAIYGPFPIGLDCISSMIKTVDPNSHIL